MAEAGADMFTFHLEASDYPLACIEKIKDNGMKVSTFIPYLILAMRIILLLLIILIMNRSIIRSM